MLGAGTFINAGGIILGGILGLFFGRFMHERIRDSVGKVCGVCVLFIGLAGTLEEMLAISEDGIVSGKSMLIVFCLVLGVLIGELINIEDNFEQFGEWLKRKTGNSGDVRFVDGFVTASLTVCIGAMAVVGSIEDGIFGDYSILATKAVLDLIIILVMTSSMGKGCVFSAFPVFVVQFSITCFAKLIKPIMTETALSNLSLVGSIMIFCVGVNLVWGRKIRVANLLPSIILAVLCSFLPINF